MITPRPILKSGILLAFLILCGLSTIQPAFANEEDDKLVIGLIPEMNVFKQMKRFQPLADHLTKKLKTKVELSILSRYGNIIDRFKEEKLDAAFLGSFTGALAISQLGVEPLARPVNMDGTSTYFGYLFAKKRLGIKTAADMKNKTFVFVERATTAGYIFPLSYLRSQGVEDIDSHFENHYFAGSHDATINAVLSGQADIGAAKNTIYQSMQKSNPQIDKQLTILTTSPRVPSNGLCVRPDMIDALKTRIRSELLQLHESDAGQEVLKALGAQRFVKTSQKDYMPVFNLAAGAGIEIEKYRYLNP